MWKYLTYEEFTNLAREWYRWGGATFYECWDENAFNEYVKEFGRISKTRALRMFRENYYIEKERLAAFAGCF
ncbi:hypothetical protein [Anaerovibrio sp.]|uniref:hypothetical protein n=1 Tax=Anaerovibrio sp. TaxID=1872532 RepID=UPI003F18ACC1